MKEDFYLNVNHHQQQEQSEEDKRDASVGIADQTETEEDWNFDRIRAILRKTEETIEIFDFKIYFISIVEQIFQQHNDFEGNGTSASSMMTSPVVLHREVPRGAACPIHTKNRRRAVPTGAAWEDESNNIDRDRYQKNFNFSEGNDIQRISILRNLPSLLHNNKLSWRKRDENEKESAAKNMNGHSTLEMKMVDQNGNSENEKLYKILPEVQETLKSGTTCLEVHLEASHAYKDLIEQLVSRDDDLSKHILHNIIENLDSPDSIASAAWLEALLDVVIHLPASLIHSFILPLTSQKSQQLSNVAARLTAAKLLGNVAYKLCPLEVKMHVVPLVQSLCQDNDAGVRAAVCQQIAIIAHSLSKDSDDAVREATLQAIAALFDAFDCDTHASVLLPLAERFVSEIIEKANPKTLVVLSKCYVALLKNCLNIQQQKWFLEKFIYLCEVGTDQELSDDDNGKDYKLILAEITGLENFKNILLPSYKKLCQDAEMEVKRNVASGFHNVIQMLGFEANQLLDSFIDLVYSGEPEAQVIAALTSNLSLILVHLYQVDQRKSAVSDSTDDLCLPYSHTQLTRILLACNRLIRNCSNWRCHEQYLLALSCMYECVSQQVLMTSFWPMLKEEVFSTNTKVQKCLPMLSGGINHLYPSLKMKSFMSLERALPCRIAALTTIIAWMKNISDDKNTIELANFFSAVVVRHKSCHKRMLYLDACQLIINRLPSQIFKIHFLDAALSMADDPVANIRVRLCKMLPIFWQTLSTEIDSLEILKKLNFALEKILSKESFGSCQSYFDEILKKVTNELSSFNSTNVDKKLMEKSNKTSNNNAKTFCPMTLSMSLVSKVKSNEIINANSDSTVTPRISTGELSATETTKLIPVDANAKQRQPLITCSISIKTHPIDISSTLEEKKLSIIGGKNDEKTGIHRNFDVESVDGNGSKLMRSILPFIITAFEQRSPSPPAQKQSLSSITAAGLPPVVGYSNKKTAIIRPRQLLNRSPSPHPAVFTTKDEEKRDSKMDENYLAKENVHKSSNYNGNKTYSHHNATSIPHQTSKTLPRKFSPTLMSISSSNNSRYSMKERNF
uniref:Serine/threonine-protein phosphatase 4 regulatory subunit 4 n=1 Tax=Romanomermis culicivorax TaxID=13658 RepID=A0A915JHX2_ROMCU